MWPSFQDGFAGLAAAQVAAAHSLEEFPGLRVRYARQRLLELADCPLQSFYQKSNSLSRPFHRHRLVVELAGSVAVVLAALLELLADQPAVMRLVFVDFPQ